MRTGRPNNNLISILIELTHADEALLESLSLEFLLDQPLPLSLTASTYEWPSLRYHLTNGGRGILVDIPELGVFGQGTVRLDFLIGPHNTSLRSSPLNLDITMILDSGGFLSMGKQKASGSLEVPLP